MPSSERRRYPRICEAISCQISLGPEVLAARTKNLSCGGLLCELPQPIVPMTKLEVLLHIPTAPSPGGRNHWIRCVGVVVRQERQASAGGQPSYLIAIYFSDIQQDDRRRIAEFILQSMLSYDRRRS
ncbi:MAG: PilZ domain-containing protein [Candidatus Omnitrophica bacterium]|nr:PilZ domain-containing protein [Candidatus Omnitrophota bacterium]